MTDGSYMESDLVCLTNTGEVHVYSMPQLRRQLRADCVSRDNIMWARHLCLLFHRCHT